jgi:signal transduction histidine kinase
MGTRDTRFGVSKIPQTLVHLYARTARLGVLLLLLGLSTLADSASLDVNGAWGTQPINLNADSSFLIDSAGQWTHPDNVRDQPWHPLNPSLRRQSFGMEDSVLWLRFHLKNSASESRSFFLMSEDHRATDIRFFVFAGDDLVRSEAFNTFTRTSDKDFAISGFPLRLTMAGGSELEVFISIKSSTPKEVELNLYSKEQLEAKAQESLEFGLIYLSAVAVIVIYNFFLFLMLREKTYLYYVLFELACGLTMLSDFGLGYRVLWPNSAWVEQIIGVSFPTLAAAILLLFTRAYFNLASTHRRWDAISLVLFFVCLGLTLASVFSPTRVVIFGLYLGVAVACLTVIFIVIHIAWQRSSSALLFGLAWLPFVGIAFFNMMMQILQMDMSSFLLVKLMMASSLWEMIFLSLALGDRYNRIQRKEVEYLLALQKKEQLAREASIIAENERREKGKFADDALKAHMLVRVIAHDLVNPISIISGNCRRILADLEKPNNVRLYVEKIEKAINNELSIISHVRELEAIQGGKTKFHIIPINLQICFTSLLEMYQDKLSEKNLTLTLTGLDEPIWVFGEESGLLFQVLSNLLSNAIKFSEAGAPISCQVRREAEFVEIVLTDSGVGMSEALRETIFDAHKATSRPGTAGERGTGFGLPIVRSYVLRYGGRISVTSREINTHPDDHGTAFHILLRPAQGKNDQWTLEPEVDFEI